MVSEQQLLGALSLLVTTDHAIRALKVNRSLKTAERNRLIQSALQQHNLALERARALLLESRGGSAPASPDLELAALHRDQLKALSVLRHAYDLNTLAIRAASDPQEAERHRNTGYGIGDAINLVQNCVYTTGHALRSTAVEA